MAGFKLKAVGYAMEDGNRAAGRHFGIEVRVHYWWKQEDKLCAMNWERRAFRGPKTGKFPGVEEEVLEYVWDLRKEGCVISHAQATDKKHGIAPITFKASNGWTTRFMRRNGLCLRRHTSHCQLLPPCYEEKVVSGLSQVCDTPVAGPRVHTVANRERRPGAHELRLAHKQDIRSEEHAACASKQAPRSSVSQ